MFLIYQLYDCETEIDAHYFSPNFSFVRWALAAVNENTVLDINNMR
jgi:hypothetical protein